MLAVFFKIFKQPQYFLLALSFSLVVFTIAIILPNFDLLVSVLSHSSVSFLDKFSLFLSLFGSIKTNFTFVSAITIILISLLFGIQISMMLFYYRQVRKASGFRKVGAVGVFGLFSGFLGVGCAACGTVLLTSGLTLLGATSILSFLPFGGVEFGFLGILLLIFSIKLLAKKIEAPFVCK